MVIGFDVGLVLFDIAFAQHGRQLPQTSQTPQGDLPETVPGGVEALHEERIVVRACGDVWDPPRVDDDGRGLL